MGSEGWRLTKVKKQSRAENPSLLTQARGHSSRDDHRNPYVVGHFLALCVALLLSGRSSRSGDARFLKTSWNPSSRGGQHFYYCFQEGECRGQTWKSGLWLGYIGWWNRKDMQWEATYIFCLLKFRDNHHLPPNLHSPLVFHLYSQVELCFQCVARMPAGFLGNLKQMDKLCDLYPYPLQNLWLIFHNGPGIWGGF